VRWLRGALVATTLVVAACSDGDVKPVPSANLEESQRFCNALTEGGTAPRATNRIRAAVPDALKDDFDKWKVNNDPDGVHKQRLNEYAHKACGFGFDEPGFDRPPTTTTMAATTSTSATVAG
jgi:hypothetical protein